jgi:hypothetical protein
MWFSVFAALPFVHVDVFVAVDGERTVRVDCNQEKTRIGLNRLVSKYNSLQIFETYIYEISLVPHVYVVDNGGFIEVSQLSHIICLIKFGWIDFVH